MSIIGEILADLFFKSDSHLSLGDILEKQELDDFLEWLVSDEGGCGI